MNELFQGISGKNIEKLLYTLEANTLNIKKNNRNKKEMFIHLPKTILFNSIFLFEFICSTTCCILF